MLNLSYIEYELLVVIRLMNQIISDDSLHSLYNLFDNFEEFRTFINVGDGFVNINTSNDYINLTKDDKKLVLKR